MAGVGREVFAYVSSQPRRAVFPQYPSGYPSGVLGYVEKIVNSVYGSRHSILNTYLGINVSINKGSYLEGPSFVRL